MAIIQFETGQRVRFDGNPTPQDVEEVANRLGINKPAKLPQGGFLGGVGNVAKGVGGFLGDVTGVKGIYEVGKEALTTKKPLTELIPKAIGSAAKTGLTLGTFGAGVPATVAGRIGFGTLTGGGFGAAESLEKGGSVIGGATKGALFGAGTAGAFELARFAVKGIPKLLSYTSETPGSVMQRQFDNPEAMKQATKDVVAQGPESVRNTVQGAVRSLRSDLSKQWEEGSKVVISANRGARVGFSEGEQKLLHKVSDEFGIDLPGNMSEFSFKEALDLNKELNELYSKTAIKRGPQGIIVRKTKDLLQDRLSIFTGAKDFLKNYSVEKQVFDAADQLVRAYNTNSPISQRTALSRLKNAFNEGNTSYVSALKDLEIKTGIPFLDKVAVLNTIRKMPKGKFGIGTLIKDIAGLAGVTSPRGAAALTRGAAKIPQLIQSPTGQALRKGLTQITSEKLSQ